MGAHICVSGERRVRFRCVGGRVLQKQMVDFSRVFAALGRR